MRILLFSDLHSEFWRGHNPLPPIPASDTYDVVVAAGDIGTGLSGIELIERLFGHTNKPLLYVLGNHEYYANQLVIGDQPESGRVTILNPGVFDYQGVRFIGATWWTRFALDGYQRLPDSAWQSSLNDFRIIQIEDGDCLRRFTPADSVRLFYLQTHYIIDNLEQMPDGMRSVVITHFVPSQMCIDAKYAGNMLNPYWVNDGELTLPQYDLHLFGHTHTRFDVVNKNGIRLVSNPMGYPGENPAPFEWKIVQV